MKHTNKKGQGFLPLLLGIIILFLIWALWLGVWLQDYVSTSLASGSITGLEAFLLSNINVFIALFFLIGIYVTLRFGGGA